MNIVSGLFLALLLSSIEAVLIVAIALLVTNCMPTHITYLEVYTCHNLHCPIRTLLMSLPIVLSGIIIFTSVAIIINYVYYHTGFHHRQWHPPLLHTIIAVDVDVEATSIVAITIVLIAAVTIITIAILNLPYIYVRATVPVYSKQSKYIV